VIAMGKALPLVKAQRRQQMERIQRLPRARRRVVMQIIDTALAQQDR
jgi:hypothetical protein